MTKVVKTVFTCDICGEFYFTEEEVIRILNTFPQTERDEK